MKHTGKPDYDGRVVCRESSVQVGLFDIAESFSFRGHKPSSFTVEQVRAKLSVVDVSGVWSSSDLLSANYDRSLAGSIDFDR